jgi:hypothetical protein
MTQEDKKLLLVDISARLPYGVILSTPNGNNSLLALVKSKKYNTIIEYDDYRGNENDISEWKGGDVELVKPYLRPLSSMTEEEFEKLKEYSGLKYEQLDLASYQNDTYKCLDFYLSEVPSYVVILVFDWLNAHHFDYRGLIERGLAIEVTESNNPYKE